MNKHRTTPKQATLDGLRKHLSADDVKILMEEFGYKNISSITRAFQVSPVRGKLRNRPLIERAMELVSERVDEARKLVREMNDQLNLINE